MEMAGSVEQGFPDGGNGESVEHTPDDLDDAPIEATTYVHIDTGFFEAQAISLFDLPWMHVLDMMTEPGGPLQIRKLITLLELALTAEDWVKVETVGFRQMLDIVSDWSTKSQPDDGVSIAFGG